jgi:hypothetical protein
MRCLLVLLLSIATATALAGSAAAHGYLVDPPGRANGTPNQDYQYCLQPPGCECGDFPDAGPIVASFHGGETITVEVDITITHGSGDLFHFQLCPPDALSEQTFADREIATFENDGLSGLHVYEIPLPADLSCDPCVLRWKWDYGFLSCADVRVLTSDVAADGRSWSTIKSQYH